MTRVVTVTSIPLERDSRTYKFAASIARFGYESVVVEGEPSSLLADDLPFQLISPTKTIDEHSPSPPTPGPTLLTRAVERLPRRLHGALNLLIYPVNRWIVIPIRAVIHTFRWNLHDYGRRNELTAPLLPDAEVYWLHSFYQARSVRRKARKLGARFLYDTPDAYWEPGQTGAANRASHWMMRVFEAIEKSSIRRAEAFTSVSDGLAVLLERRFGRRPRIVRNVHDLRLDEPADGDVRSAAGVSEDDFLLVVIGNMKPELIVDSTLAALRTLPDRVHIAFVGRGHETYQELVDELELSDRVHILGHVAPTKIVSFIRTADAAPVLSRAKTNNDLHSLPNKFFHAVAAGLPVLFPPLPDMRALANEHELGVEIDPANSASIAAGIELLSADPKAAARYRTNVERARRVLNWEEEERILAEILEGVEGE